MCKIQYRRTNNFMPEICCDNAALSESPRLFGKVEPPLRILAYFEHHKNLPRFYTENYLKFEYFQ